MSAASQRPRVSADAAATAAIPVLEVENLKKHFPVHRGLLSRVVGQIFAVDGVSFAIGPGETLCLVGESGCGKTTVAKTVTRLHSPPSGTVALNGIDISRMAESELRAHRQQMQIVFQDPYSSLNPHLSAGAIVREPLTNFGLASGSELDERVARLFERVGLRAEAAKKYPHEFSGGQRQRLGIARALAVNPALIVADEPVSALDVSVQAQVLNLLLDLKSALNLTYIFISHNLAVVHYLADRIAVMCAGRLVELATYEELFRNPVHPYTKALLAAVPDPDLDRKLDFAALMEGKASDPGAWPAPFTPSGCHFRTRCPLVHPRCLAESPPLQEVRPDHWVSCHLRQPGAT